MDRTALKPDICVYPKDDPQDGCKTDFSKMAFFIEFKSDKSYDPFVDKGEMVDDDFPFEKSSIESQHNRGQLASYAAALAGTQFRVHTFCVLVCAGHARFIRWDRSGAIVTELFDCAKNPQFFAEFFWRFDRLNPEEKGHDTSVSPVPENVPQDILKNLRERISAAEPILEESRDSPAEPGKTSEESKCQR